MRSNADPADWLRRTHSRRQADGRTEVQTDTSTWVLLEGCAYASMSVMDGVLTTCERGCRLPCGPPLAPRRILTPSGQIQRTPKFCVRLLLVLRAALDLLLRSADSCVELRGEMHPICLPLHLVSFLSSAFNGCFSFAYIHSLHPVIHLFFLHSLLFVFLFLLSLSCINFVIILISFLLLLLLLLLLIVFLRRSFYQNPGSPAQVSFLVQCLIASFLGWSSLYLFPVSQWCFHPGVSNLYINDYSALSSVWLECFCWNSTNKIVNKWIYKKIKLTGYSKCMQPGIGVDSGGSPGTCPQ